MDPGTPPRVCVKCEKSSTCHCSHCHTAYCGRSCQQTDWPSHKKQCRRMKREYERLQALDDAPGPKYALPPAAAAEAFMASRKFMARPGANRKEHPDAAAPPPPQGSCAVCLELLPYDTTQRSFYGCCCQFLCVPCSQKLFNQPCPLCRAPFTLDPSVLFASVQRHAEAGNANALYALGGWYRTGGMMPGEASPHMIRNLEALGGSLPKIPRDLEHAFRLFELAAGKGHSEAMRMVAASYRSGEGVRQDEATALRYSRKAALKGDLWSQSWLSTCYKNGEGVPQSEKEAVKWCKLASEQGQAEAQFNLACSYASGRGIATDKREALRLFEKAGANGIANARVIATQLKAELMEIERRNKTNG